MCTDKFTLIVLAFLAMLFSLFATGCAGLPKDFRAETRFGWSPLGGLYFNDTKDNRMEVDVEFDETGEKLRKLHAVMDNNASKANESIVPIQQGYVDQMQVNATVQTHAMDRMAQTADRLAAMLETVFSVAAGPSGFKFGAASAQPIQPVTP